MTVHGGPISLKQEVSGSEQKTLISPRLIHILYIGFFPRVSNFRDESQVTKNKSEQIKFVKIVVTRVRWDHNREKPYLGLN
jgi:hypothetical protein